MCARYRQLYNDILVSGGRRFVVVAPHPEEEQVAEATWHGKKWTLQGQWPFQEPYIYNISLYKYIHNIYIYMLYIYIYVIYIYMFYIYMLYIYVIYIYDVNGHFRNLGWKYLAHIGGLCVWATQLRPMSGDPRKFGLHFVLKVPLT